MTNKVFTSKKVIIVMLLLLLIGSSFIIWKFAQKRPIIYTGETFNNLPVERVYGSFSIDTEDPNQMVGSADYVFIAKVISEDGYEYRDYITKESDDGSTEKIGDPYTKYSIDIIKNIKGDLITNEVIPLQKYGGLNEDGRSYSLLEGDEFPLVGGTYIFYAYTDTTHGRTLLVGGPNSNQRIDTPDNANTSKLKRIIDNSDQVEMIENAVDTQVEVIPRERIKSIYEKE
jgi:hypothetical protein